MSLLSRPYKYNLQNWELILPPVSLPLTRISRALDKVVYLITEGSFFLCFNVSMKQWWDPSSELCPTYSSDLGSNIRFYAELTKLSLIIIYYMYSLLSGALEFLHETDTAELWDCHPSINLFQFDLLSACFTSCFMIFNQNFYIQQTPWDCGTVTHQGQGHLNKPENLTWTIFHLLVFLFKISFILICLSIGTSNNH